MNKVMLLGRLTKDPEVRYSQSAEPVAVARYNIAVNRRFKREGEPDADFINCVAFGKTGEFVERFLKKGMMIGIVGSIRVSSWEDQSGQRRWSTDVVVDEHHFAESKADFESRQSRQPQGGNSGGGDFESQDNNPSPDFTAISESIDDDDLPF